MAKTINKTLGIFLSLGESFTDLKRQGQDQLMLRQNIHPMAKSFNQVYIFTYQKERVSLPSNCKLITPPTKIHRYLYGLLVPLLHSQTISQIDIIRCFQLSGTLPAIVAKIFFKKKFVFNLGYDYQTYAQIEGKKFQAWLFSGLQTIAFRLADHFIVKNKTLYKTLPSKIKPKASYLPNGVDVNQFRPQRRKKKLPVQLLFVGRLELQKNVLNLVQAAALVKSPINLIIIGDGSLRKKVKQKAKKLDLKLKLIKKVNHHHLPAIYQQVDIFILPSQKEGSPKVLLEAMASGLACIASDIPEHREIITSGKTGLLCRSQPQILAQTITQLIQSPQMRARLGQQARLHILRHFNINRIINKEISLLKRL